MNEFSGANGGENARRTLPFSVTSNTGVMKITFSPDCSFVGGFEAEWQVNGPQSGDGGDRYCNAHSTRSVPATGLSVLKSIGISYRL